MRQHPPLYKHFSSRLLPAPGALLLGGLGALPQVGRQGGLYAYILSSTVVPLRPGYRLMCAYMIGLD